jgi:TonB family protein
MTYELVRQLRSSSNTIPATMAATGALVFVFVLALFVDRSTKVTTEQALIAEKPQVVLIDLSALSRSRIDSIGLNGPGRVGFREKSGEGSAPTKKLAHGGGGGGNDAAFFAQSGKLPQPSTIAAPIPTAPPVHPPTLPDAGIDIDPSLWKDLKDPVYGDPRSTWKVESKGPGEGEGIGTNKGLGVGSGDGAGYGPGKDGNIGNGSKEAGGGGIGGGRGGVTGGAYRASQVEQKARLLSKPEPQYTEEARRNQISGTVVLRVVFSSTGEVVQIRAVHTLPFGLTERAIAAARRIEFVPAIKGGQPVSVAMQLEYNFNLY